jgi:hypothetical protein
LLKKKSLKCLHSVLRPNTPHVIISLENTIATGGFFLSSHTLYETLIGQVHSFVLPSILTEGERPPFTIFIRRIVHYMHNAYVVNDSSDRSHLLLFTNLDDARDLFSLVTMALFLNVFDERTYGLSSETHRDDAEALEQCYDAYDLNAIPIIERHHLCYTRGLALDLLVWFFENYSFYSAEFEDADVDGYAAVFTPFAVHIGRQILKYKRAAEGHGHTSFSSFEQVRHQVQSALFPLKFARDVWIEDKADEEERAHQEKADDDEEVDDDGDDGLDSSNLYWDMADYSISRREIPEERQASDNFFEDGKTNADERFFRGLSSQFKLEDIGKSLFSKN